MVVLVRLHQDEVLTEKEFRLAWYLSFFYTLGFFIMAKAVNAVVTSPFFRHKMLQIRSLGHAKFSFTVTQCGEILYGLLV